MFRLAHISDIHLAPLPAVSIGDLFSKRITGYANWKLNRKGNLASTTLEELIGSLKDTKPDHIAVTGDLVNLALDEEIKSARKWLDNLGKAEDISVVPGNHDAYVKGSLEKALIAWRPYITGDNDTAKNSFPYRRDRGPVSLIGVNSALATPPFMATGLFEDAQKKAVSNMLQDARERGQFRIVMIHHPPFANATQWHKRLIGDALFREMVREHGAELVLHGHTHIDSFQLIDGPQHPIPVIGVPSASKAASSRTDNQSNAKHYRPGARYNLFSIEGTQDRWTCDFSDYGFVTPGEAVKNIQSRKLYADGKFSIT